MRQRLPMSTLRPILDSHLAAGAEVYGACIQHTLDGTLPDLALPPAGPGRPLLLRVTHGSFAVEAGPADPAAARECQAALAAAATARMGPAAEADATEGPAAGWAAIESTARVGQLLVCRCAVPGRTSVSVTAVFTAAAVTPAGASALVKGIAQHAGSQALLFSL